MTSQIEKITRLMGWKFLETVDYEGEPYHIVCKGAEGTVGFNPSTDKSDLMDVECVLGIDVEWHEDYVQTWVTEFIWSEQKYIEHPDKFTARAHAVCAVAEQIYDRKHNDQNTD